MKANSLIKHLSHYFLILTLAIVLVSPISLPTSIANAETAKPAQVTSLSCDKKTTTSLKVSWEKVKKASGYQIAYKKKSSSEYKKVNTTNTYKTISNLKSNTSYQVKIRAYKKVDGKKVYGKWSSVKTYKTKKNSSSSSGSQGSPTGSGVYITETGTKYHYNPNCRGLKNANDIQPCSIEYAKSHGYTLCGWED